MHSRRLLALFLVAVTPCAGAQDVFIEVLGIAQDAGYPQINCYETHCMRAWEDRELSRDASSIAVVDRFDRKKYLFDATPDLREQLYALHQVAPDDEFELAGVFLTHAHMGHYTGLMHFGREATSTRNIPVHVMPRFRKFLESNGPWDQLVALGNVRLVELEHNRPVRLGEQLVVTPFVVPHRDEYSETVGYRIDGPDRSAVFIPDIDKWEMWDVDIREVVKSVDYALVDATFFRDGELGGRDMSTIKHPLVTESMDLFDSLSAEERARVIFIHLNHTNPLLIEGSAAQKEVERRGYRVAAEGLRLEL